MHHMRNVQTQVCSVRQLGQVASSLEWNSLYVDGARADNEKRGVQCDLQGSPEQPISAEHGTQFCSRITSKSSGTALDRTAETELDRRGRCKVPGIRLPSIELFHLD